MTKLPVSEQVQVNFRMPVELRDRIRAEAENNNRSMNAEIVHTLETEYPPEDFASRLILEDLANQLQRFTELRDVAAFHDHLFTILNDKKRQMSTTEAKALIAAATMMLSVLHPKA